MLYFDIVGFPIVFLLIDQKEEEKKGISIEVKEVMPAITKQKQKKKKGGGRGGKGGEKGGKQSGNDDQQGTDFNPSFSFDASGLDSSWGSQQPWSFSKIRQDFEKSERTTQVSLFFLLYLYLSLLDDRHFLIQCMIIIIGRKGDSSVDYR